MTIQQLKYIVTVAEKGKINEAARTLFISQPSLTNAIHELEKELGFDIFNRTNRGIAATTRGTKFLSYARQVVEQMSLLESTFLETVPEKQHFQVSTQHYSFVVDAFVNFLKEVDYKEYDVTLRECRTAEIIEDVKNARSQLGFLYISSFNEKVIQKFIKDNHLEFKPLFEAKPHIFINKDHPLASKGLVDLSDLAEYPYLSFEQGEYNSFYFAEEILSTNIRDKVIRVSDRATLFNLLIGLNGYTISTGIISKELNGESIISRPLNVDEQIQLGYIKRKNEPNGVHADHFLELLIRHINSGLSTEE
jgi:regulatory protein